MLRVMITRAPVPTWLAISPHITSTLARAWDDTAMWSRTKQAA